MHVLTAFAALTNGH